MSLRLLIAICLSFFISTACFAQGSALGIFTNSSDVGVVRHPGSVKYNAADQTYEIAGSGTNMWAKADEYHFVWKKISGDFILSAQANLIDKGVDPHRKYGWIVRSTLEGDSPYADVAIHGDGLTSLQFRRTKGANTEQVESDLKAPDIFQLARKGKKYTMSVAKSGDPLTSKGKTAGTASEIELDLGDEVYVGLFVCSHNPDVVEKASFKNVRIEIPAKESK